LSGYDDALMRLPVWNLRTMCGLGWTEMASQRAELDAMIARLDAAARAAAGTVYVCPVCASRVPGRPVSR
jgi:hypothetical protein